MAPAISATPVKVTQNEGAPNMGGTILTRSSRNQKKWALAVIMKNAATPQRSAQRQERLLRNQKVAISRASRVTQTSVTSGAIFASSVLTPTTYWGMLSVSTRTETMPA